MIHSVPVLEPVGMSGAFVVAGPLLVGPGFPHPLERVQRKTGEQFYSGSNRGAGFKYWMYSHRHWHHDSAYKP